MPDSSVKISELVDIAGNLTANDLVPILDTNDNTTKSVRVDEISTFSLSTLNTDDISEASNLYYTDVRVETLVDSAYIQSRQEFSAFDSNEVQAMIDSSIGAFDHFDSSDAYVVTTVTVDSAYIQSRQAFSDFDSNEVQAMIDSSLSYIADELDTKVEDIRDTSTGTIYSPTSGRIDLDFSAMGNLWDSATTVVVINETVDSAYIQSRQSLSSFDSGEVQDMIDSAVAGIAIDAFDSSQVQVMIDSSIAGISVELDSAPIQSMIDSSINAFDHYTYDSAVVQAQIDSSLVGFDATNLDSAYIEAMIDSDLQEGRDVVFGHIHMSHASGALSFNAQNNSGGPLTKGQVVYIDGISGNIPTVALADANDPSKMPAYGLVGEDANDGTQLHVYTFGTLPNIDTTDFTAGGGTNTPAQGDTLYVSTVPGELTNVAPAGASTQLQNIGRIMRVHAVNGDIKVGGAGRTNATPNLDEGYFFYGDANNQSVATLLTDVVDSAYIADRITVSGDTKFKGSIDATTETAPSAPENGDLYVNTVAGTADASWTGLSSVTENDRLIWQDSDSSWYAFGTAGDIFLPLSGGTMAGTIDFPKEITTVMNFTTDSNQYQRINVNHGGGTSGNGLDIRLNGNTPHNSLRLMGGSGAGTQLLKVDASGVVTWGADLNMGAFHVNTPTPTAANHAANKSYVDSEIQTQIDVLDLHDSALTLQQITETVDSAYISARVDENLLDNFDSAEVQQMIDSSIAGIEIGYATTVGYNPADTSDSSSYVLRTYDAVTPATFRGDVIDNSGNVIVDVSSAYFSGTVLGSVAGNVTTPDGSTVVLDPQNSVLTIADITANGTVDFSSATVLGTHDSVLTQQQIDSSLIEFDAYTGGDLNVDGQLTFSGRAGAGSSAIAIGNSAGITNQANYSVAIGGYAGEKDQKNQAIAIGAFAGTQNQAQCGIAIGFEAGNYYQAWGGIGIGNLAGSTSQGENAIAIGNQAGEDQQPAHSIAIGTNSTPTSENSIQLKAGTTTFDVTPTEVLHNGQPISTGKNILINGNLTIDQRGKSQLGHALPTDDFVWDRWMLVANGSPQIYQIVEEGNYEPNTVYTLSWDGAEPQQATSPASGHWNIKNSFSTLPQWSSKKIQLEKGDTATEFEYEDYGTTLARCQRYYLRENQGGSMSFAYGYSNTNTSVEVIVSFPVSFRSLPSITQSNLFVNTTATPVTSISGIKGYELSRLNFVLNHSATFPGGYWFPVFASSSGYIDFNAEL